MLTKFINCGIFLLMILCISCSDEPSDSPQSPESEISDEIRPTPITGTAIQRVFGGKLNPQNLDNYANQPIPSYVTMDNGRDNPITDEGATLGRVLFYDTQLSVNNTVSCGSCHQQEFAFSDTAVVSKGVAGVTGRHSMRLVNARFSLESKFFWDERAPSLEAQTTMPIRDHVEFGFSGENGDPPFEDLLTKLEGLDYYNELFTMAYGDERVSEARIQKAIAQFIRSIQSFDSKYDEGYTNGFSNFTDSENRGRFLFQDIPTTSSENGRTIRTGGGVGCFTCHRPPVFDINPNSGNNGVIGVAGKPGEIDIDNTRAPTLRDIANPDGVLNGPLMHDGSVRLFAQLISTVGARTYDPRNSRLDPVFPREDFSLEITHQESQDLIAFLKTLSGNNLYVDPKWSNPFD